MSNEIAEREIFLWMRAHNISFLFPREVGVKINGRVPRRVVDEIDFWDFLFANKWTDVYANIFSQRQKATRLYDTILIDVDYHKGNDVWEQIERSYDMYVKIVENILEQGFYPRLYFTGRGFHIYIDFKPTRIEFYPKVIKRWFAKVFDISKELVDMKVLGDRNRMARLPMTYHSGTNLKMIRIDETWTLDTILDKVMCEKYNYPMKDYINDGLDVELKELDETIANESGYKRTKTFNGKIPRDVLKKFENLPPCIKDGINILATTGELESIWRMHIATYLMYIWGVDETVEVFRMASDFNEGKTRYFIDYFMKHEYYPLSCKRAKEYGICKYDKCVFKDLSGGWLGNLLRGDSNEV